MDGSASFIISYVCVHVFIFHVIYFILLVPPVEEEQELQYCFIKIS